MLQGLHGFEMDNFIEPTYAESLCLATVRVTASIHRVRMAPDYTDQIEGRKTMSAIEGNPICFEFTDELQNTLAMYPRKLDSLSESISVVFVGKVAIEFYEFNSNGMVQIPVSSYQLTKIGVAPGVCLA